MLADAKVYVTPHALARFRERFDPAATAELVAELVAAAAPAPAWARRFFEGGPSHRLGTRYLAAGECVLAVRADGRRSRVVLTCLPLGFARLRPGAAHKTRGR